MASVFENKYVFKYLPFIPFNDIGLKFVKSRKVFTQTLCRDDNVVLSLFGDGSKHVSRALK